MKTYRVQFFAVDGYQIDETELCANGIKDLRPLVDEFVKENDIRYDDYDFQHVYNREDYEFYGDDYEIPEED